jgi:hypothetical protein
VEGLLGHANLATTWRYRAHLKLDEVRAKLTPPEYAAQVVA